MSFFLFYFIILLLIFFLFFSSLLKLHLIESIKEKNYLEANFVSKKLEELKFYENKKIFEEIKFEQEKEKIKLECKIEEKRDKIEGEKALKEEAFKNKLKTLIRNFEKKQKSEYENFINSFDYSYPKIPNFNKLTNKYNFEIKKCIKKNEFLKANELANELENKKEIILMDYEVEKEKDIKNMIEKVKIKHKKEREEFNKKIQKMKDEFHNKQKKSFIKSTNELNNEIKQLDNFQIFEDENIDNIIKNSINKNGIILSFEMGEITKKYIENINKKKKGNKKNNLSNYD